jgi:ParB-like chromosome segregation protein Spo0J
VARRTTPLAERTKGFFDMLAEEHRPVVTGEPKRIPLAQIRPDFDQPRRALPDDLHRALRAGEIQPEQAIAALVQRAEEGDPSAGSGQALVARLLLGDDAAEAEDKGLRALAASIRQVGLRQPPTVYTLPAAADGEGPRYRIAEGERRYWAHHLLVLEGYEEFAEMPCLVEKMPDDPLLVRARQVAENVVRLDLSAIDRAWAIKWFRDFLATQVAEKSPSKGSDTDFSATQVAEKSSAMGRPRLKVTSHDLDDMVGREIGTLTRGQAVSGQMIRNYVRLTTLPFEVQAVARMAGLPERLLRPLFKLDGQPDLQLQVANKIVSERLSARDVQTLVEDLVQRGAPADQAIQRQVQYTPQDRLRRFARAGLRIRQQLQHEDASDSFYYDLLTTEEYQDVREQLLDLHRWLSDVVERLQNAAEAGLSLPTRSRYAGKE